MRSSVDLPQPEGPTTTTNSQSRASMSTLRMTFTEPKDFSTFRILTPARPRLQESLGGGSRRAARRACRGQAWAHTRASLHEQAPPLRTSAIPTSLSARALSFRACSRRADSDRDAVALDLEIECVRPLEGPAERSLGELDHQIVAGPNEAKSPGLTRSAA